MPFLVHKPIGFSEAALKFFKMAPEGPLPIRGRVTVAVTRAAVAATVPHPLDPSRFDADLALEGPSAAALSPALGLALPDTAAYRMTRTVQHAPGVWRLTGLSGTVGASDLSGAVALDRRGDRPLSDSGPLRYARQPL